MVIFLVSIHAPTWGATILRAFSISFSKFQSTLPHGERRKKVRLPKYKDKVSIHAPTWGATCLTCTQIRFVNCFNPRSHMGSDIIGTEYDMQNNVFQSTLPHGERLTAISTKQSRQVSIHAPTWGATPSLTANVSDFVVSIHAPTWGATTAKGILYTAVSFNPRSHMGSDIINTLKLYIMTSFNPRSHMGSDVASITDLVSLPISFNPRSHMGSDCSSPHSHFLPSVSIHAPTWGATLGCWLVVLSYWFQSTLPHGERRKSTRLIT